MKTVKPQYLGGLTTLFWGFQTDLLWFAVPMAIILETRYFINRRWALSITDFYRVADLTSLALVGMVVFLFLNAREYHFITTLLSWIPILIFPLVVVLGYSTTDRMRLDILFYSLRRQREPVSQSWDMDYVLLGACLLAAGLNRDGNYYFAVASIIVFAALYQLRSPRFHKNVLLLGIAMTFVAATAAHTGIRGAHLGVKAKTEQWIADWLSKRTDPMRTRTAIGQVGKLKLSDSIAFRIAPTSSSPDFPPLLQEAVYNNPSDRDWEVFDRGFDRIEHADDFRWEFDPPEGFRLPESKIYLEFDREKSLVPVPAELAEIADLPATDVKSSRYGTIQGVGLVPSPHYKVRYQFDSVLSDEPASTDLVIPEEYQEVLDRIAPGQLPPDQAMHFVQNFFKDFRYTLYQDSKKITSNPLNYFLTDIRAGHCEYFASATALLLRQLGVPSRYVVGYAIQEWNSDLEMYIVRQRHAHAWAIAYVGDKWIPVDTTPTVWLEMEENRAGLLQPLWDFLGNNQFLFQLWSNDQKIEDYETELYIIGFVLVLILIWRITTSEQVIIGEDDIAGKESWTYPGADSPFFRIENLLDEKGFRREQGELMTRWLLRIGRPELLPLLAAHYRWRFDPHGISMEDRRVLAGQVAEWLSENTDPEEPA